MRLRPYEMLSLMLAFCLIGGAVRAQEQESVSGKPPVITHSPVTYGVRGQPLTLKAKVVKGDGEIDSVTLYYALFRDAAPFRVPMRASGLDFYIGTIEASLLSGVESVSYYIEAQDKLGTIAETPWSVVEFKNADSSVAPAPPEPTPASPIPPEEKKGINKGLVAGGVAAVVAGAYLLSDSGGGGGGGGGGSTNGTNQAGTYDGTVTTCFGLSGAPADCETHPMSIVIDSVGAVFSETLREGEQLTGNLSGNDFTLIAAVNQPTGTTGVIVYSGTVLPNRIVGSISGSAQSLDGDGVYSGSFSALRQ